MFSSITVHCGDESAVANNNISGEVDEVRSGCDTNHNTNEGSGETNGMYFHLSARTKHDLPTVICLQTRDVEAQTDETGARPPSFIMYNFPNLTELLWSFVRSIIIWCQVYIMVLTTYYRLVLCCSNSTV